MLSIEEYIAKRKREDKLNEFSLDDRMENLRICVNYVFEYFNQYLDISKLDEKTVLNNERLAKYKNNLSKYEEELQEWLVDVYDNYGKKFDRIIINILNKDDLFYLNSSESDFRSVSYDCYAQLVKKHPFLKDKTELLYLFIKDYHQIQSRPDGEVLKLQISEEVHDWVENTWQRYNVNMMKFCYDWIDQFYDKEDSWPASHRRKSSSQFTKYDYDYKQKSNLFNLDYLYRRTSDKPFIKGKKQFLEILMMYFWLHEMVLDEDNYWDEYLIKVGHSH